MSYTLDPTGKAGANLVTITKTIKTIGLDAPSVLYIKDLFFQGGCSVSYTDVDGDTRTLTLGADYEFLYSIRGIIRDNPVFGAIVFKNSKLDGTIYVTCQVLGGLWEFHLQDISRKVMENEFAPGMAYWALDFFTPYLNVNNDKLALDSYAAVTVAQAVASPNPVYLTVKVELSQNSTELNSSGQSVPDGLKNFNPAQCLAYVFTTDGEFIPIQSVPHAYTYDGPGNLITDTVTWRGRQWRQTGTWVTSRLTSLSAWEPV